jgi:two-component system nitrogen regulation response regulator NtrX
MSSSESSSSIPASCASSANTCRRSTHKAGTRSTEEFSTLQQARDAYEREYILKKIEESRNNMSRAAELLGLERSHLYRKMKALGIAARE